MINLLRRRFRKQEGFTLIELLAVVAIIGVLAALAVPKVYQAINNAKAKSTKADLTTIAAALDQYYMDNNSTYPTMLNQLITGGYLKQNLTFQNQFGQWYFYAIDANTSPKAYVLADPGRNTTDQAIYRCQYDGCPATPSVGALTRTAPPGMSPAATAQAISSFNQIDNSTGGGAKASNASDLAGWFVSTNCGLTNNICRTDIITE